MARGSRAEWAKRVAGWSESGATAAEYAERIGVKEATLRHWKWQLGADHRRGGSAHQPPPFVDVTAAVLSARADAAFELVLTDGRRLRIPSSFDGDALRRILAVLEGR